MAPSGTGSPELFGRDAEVETLRLLIENTRNRGRSTVLAGEAGVGKTSLLAAARGIALEAGHVVLAVAGIEAESQFPFAALHGLLSPLIATSDVLPAPQRTALRTALGFEDGRPPALFLTGLATLNLLAEQSATAPVTVLVDDMQWLDEASQTILAIVARRLGDDPISLVTTIRTGMAHHFSDVPASVQTIRGVDEAAAEKILERERGPLGTADRARILELARGNPLALVELSSHWSGVRELAAGAGGDAALLVPTSERLTRAFTGRAEALPAATRDLLLVAAMTESDELAEIVPATSELAGRSLSPDVAAPAVEAGLVTYDDDHLHFRHPLVRSAIAGGEPPGRRQAANRALAAVLDAQPVRQVRFLAAAATGPDETVAAALVEQADAALRKGAILGGVAGLERAARLTPDPHVRGRRMLVAAEHAFGLGRVDLVRTFVRETASAPLDELDRARRTWLTEIFEDADPGNTRINNLCASALVSAHAGDLDLSLNLVYGAAVRCWWSGAAATERTVVVDTLRRLNRDTDPRVALTLAVADPIRGGADVADILTAAPEPASDDADTWRALGQAAWAIGDSVRCVDLLDRAAAALRLQGRLAVLAQVLSIQANACVTLGEWRRAEECVVEAQRLAQETEQPIWAAGSRSVASMLAGLTGAPDPRLDLSVEAEAYADSRGLTDQLACVSLARAFAHAGGGRYDQAYAELRVLFDRSSRYHHEREAIHGLMFLAETAAEVGQLREAREVLARMEELTTVTPSPLLHAHLLYARPVLADAADAEHLYVRALDDDLTRWPWVRARIELAYGVWLRRQRRLVDSRAPLRSALDRLARLGAQHWAGRAAIELRAAGERPRQHGAPGTQPLSPQELQIARLAAQGLSNREIGEQLFCSARTVASHLYHAFPKLGITSRMQLRARLDDMA